jgi:hypothetical protein
MEKSASRRKRASNQQKQLEITFAVENKILDRKTQSEVVALLARLLLQAAQRNVEQEVRNDAS